MLNSRQELTAEYLRARLSYDPETGIFRWLDHPDLPNQFKKLVGEVAGSLGNHGYWIIKLCGWSFQAHILAWLYVNGEFPAEELDHEDLNKCNNRIRNLREAGNGLNKRNFPRSSNNTSGFKGVGRNPGSGKPWRARIYVNGRRLLLGTTDTPEEAHALYVKAAEQYFGEFANTGSNEPINAVLQK